MNLIWKRKSVFESCIKNAMSILLSINLIGCSNMLKVTSDWQQNDIIIDGNDPDWQSGLYYDKESDIIYGIRNDDSYIYVLLKTENRSIQRQIIGGGLTVWFDAGGGQKTNFGIHYPLRGKEGRSNYNSNSNDEQNPETFNQFNPELEILGPDEGNIQRFTIFNAPGILVRIGRLQRVLIYELRVPLKKTLENPFAVQVTSTSRIGIGFKTSGFSHDGMSRNMPQKNGADYSGETNGTPMEGEENGGRRHSGGHRGSPTDGNESTNQLELWLSVQLAAPPFTEMK